MVVGRKLTEVPVDWNIKGSDSEGRRVLERNWESVREQGKGERMALPF